MIDTILAWIGGVTAVVFLIILAILWWTDREVRAGRNPFL